MLDEWLVLQRSPYVRTSLGKFRQRLILVLEVTWNFDLQGRLATPAASLRWPSLHQDLFGTWEVPLGRFFQSCDSSLGIQQTLVL